MIKLITTKRYDKSLAKFKKKHPQLRDKYKKTITLLVKYPHHPSLRLHKLKGTYSEYYSISLNMKYRIMLDFIIENDKIILIDIGGHELYEF